MREEGAGLLLHCHERQRGCSQPMSCVCVCADSSFSLSLSLSLSLCVCQYVLATRTYKHLEEEEICECIKGIGCRVDRVRGSEEGKGCLIVAFFIPSVCVCACVCVCARARACESVCVHCIQISCHAHMIHTRMS
jgi:hypothetical protein